MWHSSGSMAFEITVDSFRTHVRVTISGTPSLEAFLSMLHLIGIESEGWKGRPVMFLYPSANRDRREFPDPDRFDIKRRPPRILTFGHGIHACIGRHFAQMEGKLCFQKLLSHAPEYEVQESRLRRIRTEFVQGWESMPVTFNR